MAQTLVVEAALPQLPSKPSAARQAAQPGGDGADGTPNVLDQSAVVQGNIEENASSASEMAMLTDAQVDTMSTTEADTETDDDDKL